MSVIIKNTEQIEGIRRSSKLAGEILIYIEEFVKEGVSTGYLDELIHKYIIDHGAISATMNYNGYPKSCCISPNDVVCHGIPSPETILKNGDILNIDITTILNGYYGDTSGVVTVPGVQTVGYDSRTNLQNASEAGQSREAGAMASRRADAEILAQQHGAAGGDNGSVWNANTVRKSNIVAAMGGGSQTAPQAPSKQ